MSTGQFFATQFCETRFATFFHKSAPQKIARLHGRSGCRKIDLLRDLGRFS